MWGCGTAFVSGLKPGTLNNIRQTLKHARISLLLDRQVPYFAQTIFLFSNYYPQCKAKDTSFEVLYGCQYVINVTISLHWAQIALKFIQRTNLDSKCLTNKVSDSPFLDLFPK